MTRISSAFRKLPRDRPALGVAVGAGFFALASTLRWLLGGISEGFGPMTFLPAILLSGLFGGIRIGIAVALVCTFVAWVMFFPPYGTFILDTAQIVTMVVFVVTAVLELYVIRTLNVAIDELSEARERSNVLFRELQHRVANNLQFVAAVLMRRRKLLKSHPVCAEALESAQTRLETMSRVHRRLHDPKSLDQPLQTYLEALCADLINASDTPEVRLTVDSPAMALSLNGLMSLSLIVAELVTNSLKHAFADRTDGRIAITIGAHRGGYTLSVADDGPGLPKDFGKTKKNSLGQGILHSLADQLHGTLAFESGPGTIARLTFRT
ncbi:MAG TPA: histidine kinase dimerization/phosphoacceptor domain -containing protein [Sphingomicrobium sp.]|nr:histidine kinase dimerization/phosphoacceptor domain -containing protein [Sphingomicrobium sp.]